MILVDPPNVPSRGRLWSHVASDVSFEELHDFAATLGVPPRGFDRDHYDIPEELYDAAVSAGAHPVTSRELVARLTRAGLRRRKARAGGGSEQVDPVGEAPEVTPDGRASDRSGAGGTATRPGVLPTS